MATLSDVLAAIAAVSTKVDAINVGSPAGGVAPSAVTGSLSLVGRRVILTLGTPIDPKDMVRVSGTVTITEDGAGQRVIPFDEVCGVAADGVTVDVTEIQANIAASAGPVPHFATPPSPYDAYPGTVHTLTGPPPVSAGYKTLALVSSVLLLAVRYHAAA